MRSAFVLSIIFLATSFSYSQKNEASGVLLKKAGEVLYENPTQALKIGEHLLHNNGSDQESAQAYLLLSKSNLVSGNYTQAVANIQLALAKAQSADNPNMRFESNLLAVEIYSWLHLFEISNQYFADAEKLAKSNAALEKRIAAYRLFGNDSVVLNRLKFAEKLATNGELAYSFITKGTPSQHIAIGFEKASQVDSAAVYFQKSIHNNLGTYWKTMAMLDYSDYFFNKKDYPKAISLLEEALEKAKIIGNPYFVMAANQKLSNAYLASGNKTKFQEFRQKAAAAESDYDTQISLATNFAFEALQKDKEDKLKATKTVQFNICIFLGIAGFVMLCAWLFVRWLCATRIRHESDIISYLKLIKKSENPSTDAKQSYGIVEKTGAKNFSIPKETEDLLLAKLEKFEAGKKYLSKEMSLAQMAAQFETNTKYLSEIINKYKGKNINLYINELRIKYIVEKLKNDPKYLQYKVSYLAEECGFASHSSFSAVFKSITGITPNVFIQFLSEDLHENNKTQTAAP